MAGTARSEARFPIAGPGDGLYESFYLKACHPDDPLALWVRYTVHKAPHADARGSLWFTLFDAGADGPVAVKELTRSRPGHGARTLAARGRAAYELGMRETDHGIPVQPFPDG